MQKCSIDSAVYCLKRAFIKIQLLIIIFTVQPTNLAVAAGLKKNVLVCFRSPRKPVSPETRDLLEPDWTLVAENSEKVEFKKKQVEQLCEESIYEFSINLEELSIIKKYESFVLPITIKYRLIISLKKCVKDT